MVKYNPNVLQAIAFMTIMLFACDNKTVDPQKFNEVIATIIEVTPGQTLNFKATGRNAMMEECDNYGVSTFISATDGNNANATLDISVTPCITIEGTYSIQGYYDRSKANAAWQPDFASKQNGSITFTKLEGKHMEGNFNVVLYCVFPYNICDQKDSVIVSGSFNGHQL